MNSTSDATRRRAVLDHLVLAVIAYGPLLLSGHGRVNADTKSYLYIDPGRLLAGATSLWDPSVGMGTVSHQVIGYLWPMGPFFWAAERLGVPDWTAQRIWLGTILFAAGAGVLFLVRVLVPHRVTAVVAAAVYMLTPYIVAFASRASVLLLPWAGLPWLAGLVVLALRRGGWRYPAAFALVTTTIGSINASSLLFAIVGAFLWLPYALWVSREVTVRRALSVTGRTAVLTVGCNLWWAAALLVGGSYGLPILHVTETLEAVSRGSTAAEVLRSLGNWFFYGSDRLGPWVQASVPYTQDLWLIALSFGLPALGLLVAASRRWHGRGYFILLLVAGTVIAVGAYPYDDPAPFGSVLKELAESSTLGMAMRNVARATPLVALAMACFLGGGVHAISVRRPRLRTVTVVAVIGLAILNLPLLWQREVVDPNLSRAEDLPEYWLEAAAYMDAQGKATRVLEIPGSDFASYRWGNTIDPITPGLIDRPWVARESLPVGSTASVNLLTALDRRIQEGTWEPASLAPMARLMGVGDIAVRSDLQFERYRTPRPRPLWERLTDDAAGLAAPVTFGPPRPNRPDGPFPLIDEIELATRPGAPHPPPVAVFPVADPAPIVRTLPVAHPVVVSGDGEGIVDLAAAGLLPSDRVVHYAGWLDEADIGRSLDAGAELVITDSNRRRAQRWTIVRENYGYTEQAGEQPLAPDPSDGRLSLFPDERDRSRTVARHVGVESVRASGYGNTISYTPEDRPVLAVDGDIRTAWRVGGFAAAISERLLIELDEPVTAGQVRVVQPQLGARNRWITRAMLRFDGGEPEQIQLDQTSRTASGQTVSFPPRTFRSLEFEVLDTNFGLRANYDDASAVGLAELEIPGIEVEEQIVLPSRILDVAGARVAGHPLTVVLRRARSNPSEPVRLDEERSLHRVVQLPVSRRFELSGTARLSAERDDATLDAILGRPRRAVAAQSNARLPGDVFSRASKAVDGDTTTWWQPGLLEQAGHAIEVEFAQRRVVDSLDLVVVADGRHSVPTRLNISGDDGDERLVEVPPVTARDVEGAVAQAPISFEPLATRRLRVEVAAVDPVTTTDYFTARPVVLPVALAELGIDGPLVMPLPARIPELCRNDLLTIDGRPVSVAVAGSTEDAEARRGLDVRLCGRDAGGLELEAGEHVVRTVPGIETGLDVDRLVFRSVPPDWPLSAAEGAAAAPTPQVERQSRTKMRVEIGPGEPGSPFWLVLGESHNAGWRATADGVDLGPPELVNGYANGWRIEPTSSAEPLTVELEWMPQRWIWWALAASALTALVCLVLIVFPRRAFGPEPAVTAGSGPKAGGGGRWGWLVVGTVGMLGLAVAPPIAVAAALAVTGAAHSGRARPLSVAARGAPAALLALTGAYVALQQWRYDYPAAFEWPTFFPYVHTVGWIAVLSLVGIALGDVLTRHRAREEGG